MKPILSSSIVIACLLLGACQSNRIITNPLHNPITNPLNTTFINPLNTTFTNPLNTSYSNPLRNTFTNPLNTQLVGGAIGGVVGGVLGKAVTKGKTAGTIAGSVFGALAGSQIAKGLIGGDEVHAGNAMSRALSTGQTEVWANSFSGNSGTIIPYTSYTNSHGRVCRNFQHDIRSSVYGGSGYRGLACLNDNGLWSFVR